MINRIKVIDRLSGKRAWQYYQLYRKTQWYSAAEMERFQVEKLRELLRHCAQSVPFYRDVIRGAGIDVEGFESMNVLEQFPVIDKATVKQDQKAFSSNTTRGFGPMRMVHTGGTTGEPLFFLKDAGLRHEFAARQSVQHQPQCQGGSSAALRAAPAGVIAWILSSDLRTGALVHGMGVPLPLAGCEHDRRTSV